MARRSSMTSVASMSISRHQLKDAITDVWLGMLGLAGKAPSPKEAVVQKDEISPVSTETLAAADARKIWWAGVACCGRQARSMSSDEINLLETGTAMSSQPAPEVPSRQAEETVVSMTQLVLPSDASTDGSLLAGPLLKWIDICACMSAERFSGTHCVTASMEDIHFLHKVQVGEIVKLTARVHQAWKTSMEVGVTVTIERLGEHDAERDVCCHAMSTFVSKDKKILPELKFSTAEQKALGNQADLRKGLRVRTPKKQGQEVRPPIADGTTISTELVMPHHCQHMGTTFGGWIMQWMECTASIAAARHTRSPMMCVSTDTLNFLAPSHAGDAVELRAVVTCVWNTSLEIGCWASAEDLREGTSKPICQMYATYALSGEARVLPPLISPSGEEVVPSAEAYQRRAARLQRKALKASGELSLDAAAFGDRAARSAVRNLQELCREDPEDEESTWETLFDGPKHGLPVVLAAVEGFPTTCIRIRFSLGAPPEKVHAAVNDFEDRKSWDTVVAGAEVLRRAKPEDYGSSGGRSSLVVDIPIEIDMMRMTFKSGHDAVLARARMTSEEQEAPTYISVSRSIRHPDAPPADRRVEVLPSGWVLRPDGKGGCKATYALQLGASGLGLMLSSMDGKMQDSTEITANLFQAKENMLGASSGGMLLATIRSVIGLMKKFPPVGTAL